MLLAVLLKHHLESHDHSPVFPNTDGGFLWRSSWRTRTFNYAFDGNQHLPNPRVHTCPIRPGLTFHELRHSHKTWLIAAGIPEIAQARRLCHRLDKRVVEVYSHVADAVEARIQTVLKHAWLNARHTIANHPTPPPVRPRTGWIRRHLPHETNPASIVTSSSIDVPHPRPPTSTNTAASHPTEDRTWSNPPHSHPIFDQDHVRGRSPKDQVRSREMAVDLVQRTRSTATYNRSG